MNYDDLWQELKLLIQRGYWTKPCKCFGRKAMKLFDTRFSGSNEESEEAFMQPLAVNNSLIASFLKVEYLDLFFE